ncbi:mitogen-activated protein kinase 15 [Cyrtonyx montezumae]|uniref:mitogen-activated protein kinase 15 n=1 Tax=Cyrtonyx montezumae TaxID=9017 RepID=UPI0032DAA852
MSAPEVDAAVAQKYKIKRRLGMGAYGIVWKAVHRSTGEAVAVKKIFDAFRTRTDTQRTLREIACLREFGEHPNIVRLLDVISARNHVDMYLVFEAMQTDLHAVLQRGGVLQDIHCRYIVFQLLRAASFIHAANVAHRDIKPSNVLLDSSCRAKLCDFGLARSLSRSDTERRCSALSHYVATRWYRAPELLLCARRYTVAVDMWAVGCVLGEVLLGAPLFPGSTALDQMQRILSVIAPTPHLDIGAAQSELSAAVLDCVRPRRRVPLEALFPPCAPRGAVDLVRKLLVFDPRRRLTAEEALRHPYVRR